MDIANQDLRWAQEALKARIDRWTRAVPNYDSAVSGLSLHRDEAKGSPHAYIRDTALCLILQGAKRVTFGSEVLVYDESNLLLASVDVPVVAEVLEASPGRPYLSLVLRLDQKAISEFVAGEGLPPPRPTIPPRPLFVSRHTFPLLLSVLRLVDLLDEPDHIPAIAPLIQKEIIYQLLVSEMGGHLRQTVSVGTPSAQISRSIEWLRSHYRQPLRIEDLASLVHMSTTAFHHHFKQLTAMSPLQYQKWLRLHEARRLMLADRLDVTRAAYEVGYESRSQFGREYRRLFDAPPGQDIKDLRTTEASPPLVS